MARGPGHRPLILLRWVLLGLLLAAGAVVLRLYLQRDTTRSQPRAVADDPQGLVESEDVVLAAEGFEYEVIDEGVTLFFIRSNRMVSDRQDRFVLEGVELRMEEEDGGIYTIVSERAVYDLESRGAHLEGGVVMSGPDGIELRGASFDLLNSGNVLESTAPPVSYRLPNGFDGTATSVRINLNRNALLLRGEVAIDSPPGAEPPLRLTAGRMLYQQVEGLLRAEDDVVFERGLSELRAQRLTATLETGDGGVGAVRFIQGRWQVTGRLALDASSERSSAVEFEAGKMGVSFGAGKQVERVVLEGVEEWASLRLEDGAGLRQTLVSDTIHVGFAGGAVSRLETFQPAVLLESLALPGAPPLRRLCGDALAATLGPDGTLSEVDLDGSVDYRDARLSASGDRLVGNPERRLRLSGQPARLIAGADDVEAPKIVYSRDAGSLLASGGVRATGLDRSGVELAAGDARAPVLVTAEQATWSEEPPRVEFRGGVRAWQGESFLLADLLRSVDGGARLEGEGSVKTVWRPRPDDVEGRRPVEVNADEFVYAREEKLLSYTGKVRAHEAGRTVRCKELDIRLDEERQIESLFCQGDAVINDPANGRTVRGDEALYTPGDRLVVISGAPVVLQQRDGTEMEGRRLRYDLETGEVRILSEPRTSGPEAVLGDPREPDDG